MTAGSLASCSRSQDTHVKFPCLGTLVRLQAQSTGASLALRPALLSSSRCRLPQRRASRVSLKEGGINLRRLQLLCWWWWSFFDGPCFACAAGCLVVARRGRGGDRSRERDGCGGLRREAASSETSRARITTLLPPQDADDEHYVAGVQRRGVGDTLRDVSLVQADTAQYFVHPVRVLFPLL